MAFRMDMVRPCAKCPFRTDVEPYLTAARVREFETALVRRQATFTCHETTVDEEDGDERVDGPNAQHCAGALILLEKVGRPNQLMDAPVFGTFAAMRRAQGRK